MNLRARLVGMPGDALRGKDERGRLGSGIAHFQEQAIHGHGFINLGIELPGGGQKAGID